VAFTGHPTVGDGGWDQQASETVAFTAALLRHGDPAATSLLGTLGAKYLLDFSYPATEPDLLSDGASPLQQQHAVATIPGLERVTSNRAGTVYRLPGFMPFVSFRPRIAVVLGGREGLAAFADTPGIHLDSWAVFTADDLLAHESPKTVLAIARRANELVVADATPNDLAVLGSPSVASLAGITSSPDLEAQTHIISTDASTRLGSLASETTRPAASGRRTATTTFRVARAERLELWARVRSGPSAAQLTFKVDGRAAGSLVPVTAVGGGFRWYLIARPTLRPGVHRLAVRARESAYGSTYELDEAKIIRPSARDALRRKFVGLLRARANHILYSFVPAQIQRPLGLKRLHHPVAVTPGTAQNFWRIVDPTRVHETMTKRGPLLGLVPTRRYHTFVEHSFGRPLDWSGVDHIYLRLRGIGAETSYRFVVDFNRSHRNSVSFLFTLGHPGWSTHVFAPSGLGSPYPEEWSHVTSIRIATDDRSTSALLGLGSLRVSQSRDRVLRLPLIPGSRNRTAYFGGHNLIHAHASALALRVPPRFLAAGTRVVVPPVVRPAASAPPQVTYERSGAAGYRFAVRTRTPGVLVVDQAYDPRWQLRAGGRSFSSISTFGLVNGYLLPAGIHKGSIQFRGNQLGQLGAGLSAAALFILLGLALWTRPFGRRLDP